MAEIFQDAGLADGHVAGVVENRHIRPQFARGGGGAFIITLQNLLREKFAVGFDARIEAALLHPLQTGGAAALALIDDVQKDAVAVREKRGGLFNFGAQQIEISGVEAELDESGMQRVRPPALRRNLMPFGVQHRHALVEAGSDVDRHIHIDLLARIELGAQQVELQVRMHFSHLGRVIAPAVMADRETGDGIHMRVPQLPLPFFTVERLADSRNIG